jgi:nucleoside-diphosphate-sugar epimerase
MNVLITGASGFIGNAVALNLASRKFNLVHASVRKSNKNFPDSIKVFENMDLLGDTDWSHALKNIDVVIHCAASAHLVHSASKESITSLLKVNVNGTEKLAHQAALFGVKRFIFLSTLAVHGAETSLHPFSVDDEPRPHSDYARSKLEAEKKLVEISQASRMSWVVIRPPLVYGPNAPGKFRLLVRCVRWRLPLPLGKVKNKKSFVFLDNLVDLIICCINNPSASNQVFLVSDDEDISTTQFIRKIGTALNKPTFLLPIPVFILRLAAKFFGKQKLAEQLLSSLQVDIEKTKIKLRWKPPFNVDAAMSKAMKNKTL